MGSNESHIFSWVQKRLHCKPFQFQNRDWWSPNGRLKNEILWNINKHSLKFLLQFPGPFITYLWISRLKDSNKYIKKKPNQGVQICKVTAKLKKKILLFFRILVLCDKPWELAEKRKLDMMLIYRTFLFNHVVLHWDGFMGFFFQSKKQESNVAIFSQSFFS